MPNLRYNFQKCKRKNHYKEMCKAREINDRIQNIFSLDNKANDLRTVDKLLKYETEILKTK